MEILSLEKFGYGLIKDERLKMNIIEAIELKNKLKIEIEKIKEIIINNNFYSKNAIVRVDLEKELERYDNISNNMISLYLKITESIKPIMEHVLICKCKKDKLNLYNLMLSNSKIEIEDPTIECVYDEKWIIEKKGILQKEIENIKKEIENYKKEIEIE